MSFTDFLDYESKLLMNQMNYSFKNSLIMESNEEIIQAINNFEFEIEVENVFNNLHRSLEPSHAYHPWIYISMLLAYFVISMSILSVIVKTWCPKRSVQE